MEVVKVAVRIVEVSVVPSPLCPGAQATAKCLVDTDAPIRRVYVILPDGETREFQRVSPTEFELTEQVPWDAPPGTYPITIVAETESGEKTTLATTVTIS